MKLLITTLISVLTAATLVGCANEAKEKAKEADRNIIEMNKIDKKLQAFKMDMVGTKIQSNSLPDKLTPANLTEIRPMLVRYIALANNVLKIAKRRDVKVGSKSFVQTALDRANVFLKALDDRQKTSATAS